MSIRLLVSVRRWRLLPALLAGALLAAVIAGCAAGMDGRGTWSGPKALTTVKSHDISVSGETVRVLQTQHYLIYSTMIDRDDLLQKTAQLMEGGFTMYQQFVPTLPPTTYPMQCYLFSTRPQWERFTREHTGPASSVYLKIGRGGYTIHDWYVAYYIGDISTYSVAAHEGWHQFVNRHFKGRLPPFLEEGIACMFEHVEWDGDLPRWNLSINPTRTESLRKAMDAGELFKLDKLITLHAGIVVGQSPIRIEAFYAQDWAFARFLWEGENGRYRPALQKLLLDTAAGEVYDPTGSLRRSYLPWNPAGVRPMLEHYLGEPLDVTSAAFDKFMAKIAYEEIQKQYNL